tara:strand:+ start:640 stop:927 length:288 start_codon:yes stop_codon:yes gene_type:complete
LEKLARIPKRFYDDHVDRELPAPEIIKQTKQHYWIDLNSEHLGELLSDADCFGDYLGFEEYVYPVIHSARATTAAIEKAMGIQNITWEAIWANKK